MARDEQDREDLLAEATALVERVELRVGNETVVAGFRRDGSASVFFGADPVYQFNSQGELRRAFVEGRLMKADRGRLATLTRQRAVNEVALVRHDLNDAETNAFLARMATRLTDLRDVLAQGKFNVVGQVPVDGDVARRVLEWLNRLPADIAIAGSPHAR